jgi:hypothetical protein
MLGAIALFAVLTNDDDLMKAPRAPSRIAAFEVIAGLSLRPCKPTRSKPLKAFLERLAAPNGQAGRNIGGVIGTILRSG